MFAVVLRCDSCGVTNFSSSSLRFCSVHLPRLPLASRREGREIFRQIGFSYSKGTSAVLFEKQHLSPDVESYATILSSNSLVGHRQAEGVPTKHLLTNRDRMYRQH